MVVTSIPAQERGVRTGASTHEESPTRHAAILLFEEAKKRLLDINHWDRLCGPGSASFQLTDNEGRELRNVQPEVGHFIRIKLPGPGNPDASGYDWVRIEAFENHKDLMKDEDIFGFRVRPAKSPVHGENNGTPHHFFTEGATSTFLILRVSSTVKALEKGRNEQINSGTRTLAGRIRNLVIAAGAWMGFSNSQWGRLVRGIIKGPPQD